MRRAQSTRLLRSLAAAGVAAALAVTTVACTSSGSDASNSGTSNSDTSQTASGEQGASGTDAAAGDTIAPEESSADLAPTEAPEVTIPAPATTVVPAPSGGDINQEVSASEQTTLPAAPLVASAEVTPSVTATITSVERIDGEGRLPGEFTGPAVAVHVSLANTSDAPLDASGVTVAVADGNGAPMTTLSGAPAQPFAGSIEPGASADAVYVFTIGESFANPVNVSVNPAADAPVALFVGEI